MYKPFLFLLCLSTLIYAQQKSKVNDTLVVKMNQITVSATRSPEMIMEVPYAVTVIDSKQLISKRGYGIDEAIGFIPGVLAQSRSGNQDVRIVIRGFGARGAGDRSNSGTTRGLKILVDGIPETEPDGRTSLDMVEISSADNIEVIRSNASATWGNAAGGIINLATIPSAQNSFLRLNGSAGSFGFNMLQTQAMAKFKDGKIFINASNTNFRGWRNHSSSYRTLISSGVSALLDESTNLIVLLQAASNLFHIPGPLTQNQFNSDPSQSNPFYLQRDERRINKLGRIGVTLDHKFDDVNSISAMAFASPKFLQRSERGTFRDFTRYHIGGSFIYKNQLKFPGEINNQISAGIDEAYQDGAILFYSLSATNQRGETLKDNKREGANTFGLFLQDELIFGDKLSLILGGRFDNVTYYSESFISSGYGLNTNSFRAFTPKAGISYRFSNQHSIYANLGGGVEVPAGNETDPSSTYGDDKVYLINPLLEPIVSTTYELGTKQIIYLGEKSFLQSFNYDAAFYFIDVKNDIIPYRGGKFYFTAGKTARTGLEIAAEVQLQHGLNFKGSFTYSNNKYDDYRVDSVHYGKAGKIADYSGNKMAGIPDYFYNLNVTYQPAFAKLLFVSLGLQAMGSYYVDDCNLTEVKSYSILNLTAGLSEPVIIIKHFSVSAFITVNNLLDAKYAASAFINPDIINNEAYFLEPGLPRNIVLGIRMNLL